MGEAEGGSHSEAANSGEAEGYCECVPDVLSPTGEKVMGGFSIKIEGLAELDRMLSELKDSAARKVMKEAMTAGGEVFVAAVVERAPERVDLPSGDALPPGALKSDITLEVLGGKDRRMLVAIVAPGKMTWPAAMWVEYGHDLVRGGDRHRVYDREGNWKGTWRGAGKLVERATEDGETTTRVDEHPFIRPAYEAVRETAVDVTLKTLAAGIEREAAKGK